MVKLNVFGIITCGYAFEKFSSRFLVHTIRLFLAFLFLSQTACSIEASLESLTQPTVSNPVQNLNRVSPDFVAAETVTSGSGYQIKGVIGDMTDKKTLSNGYQIQGVFNE